MTGQLLARNEQGLIRLIERAEAAQNVPAHHEHAGDIYFHMAAIPLQNPLGAHDARYAVQQAQTFALPPAVMRKGKRIGFRETKQGIGPGGIARALDRGARLLQIGHSQVIAAHLDVGPRPAQERRNNQIGIAKMPCQIKCSRPVCLRRLPIEPIAGRDPGKLIESAKGRTQLIGSDPRRCLYLVFEMRDKESDGDRRFLCTTAVVR